MKSTAVAQLENLHHAYGARPALDDVDLELASGQVTALLGPNGAGKTTLIHLLLGLLPCRAGSIRLFGDLPPGHRQARTRIGVMLQQSGVQENLTVRELIEMFASFYPAPATVDELLDECGLAGLDTRRFDRLSGGQRQRVLYALGVVGRPELLVLDEPTTGLDPAARRRMWTAIEARRAAGTAILLSTHFMEEAERLADRICVLDHGRLCARPARRTRSAARCRATPSGPAPRSASSSSAHCRKYSMCGAPKPASRSFRPAARRRCGRCSMPTRRSPAWRCGPPISKRRFLP